MQSDSNSLETYQRKRDFTRTTEPAGRRARVRKRNLCFLVQKHEARRLHYDFRLEWNGVLLSWAVTRGPSLDPGEKRLAVQTEDHPLSYADFEGTIPKGEYGGGTVMLWDRGGWEPLDDPDAGLKAGKLHLRLDGERMKGEWVLVKLRSRSGKGGRKDNNWLLIKVRDEHARDEPDSLTERYTTSIVSRRGMAAIEAGKEKSAARQKTKPATGASTREHQVITGGRKRQPLPRFHKVQLATLVDKVPEGDDWLHETKFDGYRCLAALGSGELRLYSRSGLDWTDKFAPVSQALSTLSCRSALLDGEIMASQGSGQSDFSALQKALKQGAPLDYYAFDLLQLDGKDLTGRPLLERKQALQSLLSELAADSSLKLSEYVVGNGHKVLEHICRAGGEGIISKRIGAGYRSGRNRQWLKIKCTRRQEFVVGGFSPSDKRGRPFSSLLIGQYEDDGSFHYRGRVGTGFSEQELERLQESFGKLARASSPFVDVPAAIGRRARWLKPAVVVEVDFAEFTDEGHVRHGVYLGTREDKKPREVSPERSLPSNGASVAGISISNPDRELFPSAGLSKRDLADYYHHAGERMTAIAANRPVSLVRCPSGLSGACFFQKHAGKGFPEQLRSVAVREKSGKVAKYLYFDEPLGLVAAAQMGVIEFHMWGSRNDKLEKPDRLVFDLDPDQGLDFARVKQAAVEVREVLLELGLKSSVMLTGGKGIHVCVPLRRTVSWETVKTFARTLATLLGRTNPDAYTATMSKAKRKGKIFIDWLRNERGATAVVPYSVRARPGAPVALPLSWRELDAIEAANSFSVRDACRRIAKRKRCPYLQAMAEVQGLNKSVLSRLEALL